MNFCDLNTGSLVKNVLQNPNAPLTLGNELRDICYEQIAAVTNSREKKQQSRIACQPVSHNTNGETTIVPDCRDCSLMAKQLEDLRNELHLLTQKYNQEQLTEIGIAEQLKQNNMVVLPRRILDRYKKKISQLEHKLVELHKVYQSLTNRPTSHNQFSVKKDTIQNLTVKCDHQSCEKIESEWIGSDEYLPEETGFNEMNFSYVPQPPLKSFGLPQSPKIVNSIQHNIRDSATSAAEEPIPQCFEREPYFSRATESFYRPQFTKAIFKRNVGKSAKDSAHYMDEKNLRITQKKEIQCQLEEIWRRLRILSQQHQNDLESNVSCK